MNYNVLFENATTRMNWTKDLIDRNPTLSINFSSMRVRHGGDTYYLTLPTSEILGMHFDATMSRDQARRQLIGGSSCVS